MSTLQTRLNTIGISGARGIDLMMQRDQIRATVSDGEGGKNANAQSAAAANSSSVVRQELSAEEKRVVAELQQIDRQVREHERAHLAAGHGVITSTADFSYTYGPDGRAYATAGEVGIDTSPERKPEDNIYKGQRIQAAALAPRDPSATDYRVASIGSRMELQGRSDLAQQQFQEFMAEQEAGAEKRTAERSQSTSNTSPTPPQPVESGTAQVPRESRQLMQNAYATVADDSASSGRVSFFA